MRRRGVRWLLVRHGETEWNRQGRLQGWSDVPLSPEGRRAAEAMARVLADEGVRAVYASDLGRARDSAAVIGRHLGLPVRVDPRWRELHFGEWEGLTFHQVQQRWETSFRQWRSDPVRTAPSGGETVAQLAARVGKAVAEIRRVHPGETVAVVTHGGPIRVFLCDALGVDLRRQDRWVVSPGSLTEVVDGDGEPYLVRLNVLPPGLDWPAAGAPARTGVPTLGGGPGGLALAAEAPPGRTKPAESEEPGAARAPEPEGAEVASSYVWGHGIGAPDRKGMGTCMNRSAGVWAVAPSRVGQDVPPALGVVLVLGGARSGKSAFAQELALRWGGPQVLFVATAEARDEEMRRRILAHRRSRPSAWRTVEAPRDVAQAIGAYGGGARVVLVDCLTLLVSNVMFHALGTWSEDEATLDPAMAAAAEEAVAREVEGLAAVAREAGRTVIIVSNEVGAGLVPPHPVSRLYRDLLGWANQRLARQAAAVYWLVAGIPLQIR